MKKKLLSAALATLFVSSAAMADTVRVTSETTFSDPSGGSITSSDSYAFRGTKDIVFTVAGKTCTLNGSARGSVPMGCNYKIAVAPNGSISGELAAGNSVCTQTPSVASSCK
jgi:opacity protein-like surface antigen